MPNKTFEALSAEKKEAVIQAALKEFTTHDYVSASLNNIIHDIGIAKGSFYRYFDNKKELYDYLISYGLEKKAGYAYAQMEKPADDIYTSILNTLSSFMSFTIENEALSAFLLKAFFNGDLSRDDFLFLKDGKKILLDEIIRRQGKDISDRYSTDFIFFCITQILIGTPEYIKEKYLRETPGLKPGEIDYQKSIPIIENTYKQIVDFIEHGLHIDQPK